jgi:Ca2+-binding RTX toxin-like protein
MRHGLGWFRAAVALAMGVGAFAVAGLGSAGICFDCPAATSHADVMEGTSGADTLDAKAGHDRVDGKGGDDTLIGGPGRDLLIGGAGDDTIRARDGYRDAVYCGAGRDSVEADSKDVVSPTCERGRPKGGSTPGTLYVNITSANNGGGIVNLITEHPTHALPPCGAAQCAYSSWPVPGIPTVLITVDADLGSVPSLGGDCAGSGILGCRLTMDSDKVVTAQFNGSG